jgi:predicted ribosomally synthesized peptide with nif11-like leader
MAIQDALRFIHEARRDEALRRELEALNDEVTMDDLVFVAAATGFSFTAEELRQAHMHDWRMRWARYQPR